MINMFDYIPEGKVLKIDVRYDEDEDDWVIINDQFTDEDPLILWYDQNNHCNYYTWVNRQFDTHNTNGPAQVCENGDLYWYKNNKRHNDNGPAVIRDDTYEWWQDGEKHREDGPAIVVYDPVDLTEHIAWYYKGRSFTRVVNDWLEESHIDWKDIATDEGLKMEFRLRFISELLALTTG